MSNVLALLAASAHTGGWTPAEITTLAWYDATDSSTITESGGEVSIWEDKSGNDYHATQAGSGKPLTGSRTLGGLNALDFDGAGDNFSLVSGWADGEVDMMVFGAVDIDGPSTGQRIFTCQVGVSSRHLLSCESSGLMYNQSEPYAPVTAPDASLDGVHLVSAWRNSDMVAVGIDGVYTSGGSRSPTPFTLDAWYIGSYGGASNWFNGAIGELVFIPGYDNDTRLLMEEYMNNKWSL